MKEDTPARTNRSKRIDDYALLGDTETAALVGRDGTISGELAKLGYRVSPRSA